MNSQAFGEGPVSLHGRLRRRPEPLKPPGCSGPEVPQFDQFGLPGILEFQPGQGLVHGHPSFLPGPTGNSTSSRFAARSASMADPKSPAGFLRDQDPPHGFGGGGEEVAPVVPASRLIPARRIQAS